MKKKPEWSPENSGNEFASFVVDGTTNPHAAKPVVKKHHLIKDASFYIDGIKKGDRTALAQSITIIESNSPRHFILAQDIISSAMAFSGNSVRIGITGAPGAGKSTFIDVFGSYLCSLGYKVAVLAVDPSSSVTKGSILGDKTRMDNLSREPNSFIRPSPAGNNLGGVARKTRESLIVCEAAGYDIIIIETIGVGQSEIVVRSMVDFFLLLLMPGAGDELQGFKKGTVELADAIIVNKADGENADLAELTRHHYAQAVHYLRQATPGWDTAVLTASAIRNSGIKETWDTIMRFVDFTHSSDVFADRRNSQLIDWMHNLIIDNLKSQFYSDDSMSDHVKSAEADILSGKISVALAVRNLLDLYSGK